MKATCSTSRVCAPRLPRLFLAVATALLLSPAACKKPEGQSGYVSPGDAPLDPKAGEVRISKTSGLLKSEEKIVVTFPTDMVGPDELDKNAPSPLVFYPTVEHTFKWVTPRRGVLETGYEISPIPCRLSLRPDLVDREGHEVNARGWGAELAMDELGLLNVEGEVDSPLPEFKLTFSRNVRPSSLVDRVEFVDTKSDERVPVSVFLEDWQTDQPQCILKVKPRVPLSTGREYWLAVQKLKAADDLRETAYLHVYEAGSCERSECLGAKGYNQPREGAFVRVYFNGKLDRTQVNASYFKVTPPVPDLKVEVFGKMAVVKGGFREDVPYKLEVLKGVPLRSGFTIEEDSEPLDILVPGRRAAVVMPDDFLAQRFSKGMDVPVTHSLTGALTWTLAEVPAAKIPELQKRLREFAEVLKDSDGKAQLDPRDESFMYKPTQALIPALGLKTVASDTFPAAPPSGEEVERRVKWKPATTGQQAGLYLLEVTGRGLDGRECGNRSIISLSDWYVNYMVAEGKRSARVCSMRDGQAVAGIRVQMYDEEGKLMDEALTDAQGIAPLEKFPASEGDAKFILAGNAQGYCYQQGSYSRPRSSTEEEEEFDFGPRRKGTTGVLTTNGDLYQPGETIQMFALVRSLDNGGAPLPAGTKLNVRVTGGSEEEELDMGEISMTLDAHGAAETAWPIPAELEPTMLYFHLEDEKGDIANSKVTVTEFEPPLFSTDMIAEHATGTKVSARIHSGYFYGSPNKDAQVRWTAEWVLHDWLEGPLWRDVTDEESEEEFDLSMVSMEDAIMEDDEDEDDSAPSIDAGDFVADGFKHISDLRSADFDKPLSAKERWEEFSFTDAFSPNASQQGMEGIVIHGKAGSSMGNLAVPASRADRPAKGEESRWRLDDKGEGQLVSECPFPPLGRSHRAEIYWTADVVTPTGVTRRVTTKQMVQFPEYALALRAVQEAESTGLPIHLTSITVNNEEGKAGLQADVEVFRREMNTTPEIIADHLVRYRNTPEFHPVGKKTRVTLPYTGTLEAPEPGDYVVLATPVENPLAVPVSVEFTGVGQETELALENGVTFEIKPDKEKYTAGEVAKLNVRTPFPGTLRVMVDTGSTLETLPLVQMKGTAEQITVPLRAAYFPNVHIRAHLVSLPAEDAPPAERFAEVELQVHDPETLVSVVPELDTPEVLPRGTVSGKVRVQAGAKPLANAEVMVFAIDDAVLSLGEWTLPELQPCFFPPRRTGMSMNASVGEEWRQSSGGVLSQFEKGYILGSGFQKLEVASVTVRENANPRPYWKLLRTDANGLAPFTFAAPDSLTSYRITAVAFSQKMQMGEGAAHVKVINHLRVEPVVPQFVREGDELELLSMLTQDTAVKEMAVKFQVKAEGPVTPGNQGLDTVALKTGVSQYVGCRIKVASEVEQGASVVLTFQVTGPAGSGLADAMRVTLPVLPRFKERTEIVTGNVAGGESWNVISSIRPEWTQTAGGKVDVMLSGTRWLGHLASLGPDSREPMAFTDLAAAAITPFMIPQLGAYLPWQPAPENEPAAEDEEDVGDSGFPAWLLKHAAEQSEDLISEVEGSLIPDEERGWLPKYPHQAEKDDPTTAMVTWAVALARNAPELVASMQAVAQGNAQTILSIYEAGMAAGVEWKGKTLEEKIQSLLAGASPKEGPFAGQTFQLPELTPGQIFAATKYIGIDNEGVLLYIEPEASMGEEAGEEPGEEKEVKEGEPAEGEEGEEGEESSDEANLLSPPEWPEDLQAKLDNWLASAVDPGSRAFDQPEPSPFVQAVALSAQTLDPREVWEDRKQALAAAARSLYARRNQLDLEGRCFLALGVSSMKYQAEEGEEPVLEEKELAQLMEEIITHPLPTAVNPETRSTPRRAAAIRLFTLSVLENDLPKARKTDMEREMLALQNDPRRISPQENVWRLLTVQAALEAEAPAVMAEMPLGREDYVSSNNGVTVGWLEQPATSLASNFSKPFSPGVPMSWMLRATYRAAVPNPVASSGLTLTREVRALSDTGPEPARQAELKAGDYVLVTYHITSDRERGFVQIDDEMPTTLKTLNPDIAAVRKAFPQTIPVVGKEELALSFERHGESDVHLVFDRVPQGTSTYCILASVVCAGKCSWPAAEARVMYDEQLTALTNDVQVISRK